MRFMIPVKATADSEAGVLTPIEVRQLFELEGFERGPGIDRFRELELPSLPPAGRWGKHWGRAVEVGPIERFEEPSPAETEHRGDA